MSPRLSLTRPLISFDLETTGLDVREDRIVEISCVKIYPDGQREIRTRRLNPERSISKEAAQVHGITPEDVAEAPTFRQIARSLLRFLEGCDLTGFNLESFDLKLLKHEFARVGLDFPAAEIRIVDSRRIFMAKEPRTLAAAYTLYCGKELDGAHSAEADALAAADILLAQIERYPDLPPSMDALHEFCQPDRSHFVDEQGKLIWRDDCAVLAFGKYRGKPLQRIVTEDPEYLQWVTTSDFPEDTKSVIRQGLAGVFPQPVDASSEQALSKVSPKGAAPLLSQSRSDDVRNLVDEACDIDTAF
ncbi:MAG: 3'-5' exonuclease [Myxococcota bacterium]